MNKKEVFIHKAFQYSELVRLYERSKIKEGHMTFTFFDIKNCLIMNNHKLVMLSGYKFYANNIPFIL